MSHRDDFRQRIITDSETFKCTFEGEDDKVVAAYASRTRTSKGFCSISLEFDKQKIRIESDRFGDSYEQIALGLAKLLDRIASDPCELDPRAEK